MSTTQLQVTTVPVGTWRSDPVHSTFGFSVTHMIIATFRGSLTDFDATATGAGDGTATLSASGRVASVVTQDDNLTGHIQSPDFFDAQRHPEVRYTASDITRDGEDLRVRGELTLKGTTLPLELTGTIAGPVETGPDTALVAIDLEGVIDRRDYGLSWNNPLPGGGFAVGNDVRLVAHLEMARA